MRASLKWLKDYVDITDEPAVLAEKLTRAGVPVEWIEELGTEIDKVVTGRVVAMQRHPEADRLWICTIEVGAADPLVIVTGAQNVSEGDVVPVATVGASLPGGKKIGQAKLRGVESFGMLCSATELAIDSKLLQPEQREGILLLPRDTEIGVDVRTVLGLDDTVFEFELTANRPDCFSMIGLAREIAALTGAQLKKPMLNVPETAAGDTKAEISIAIRDGQLCPRFAARLLKNVRIAPSPQWMQRYLNACGIRAINNVVDVTNFVMLEMGQPMHAYDYDLIEGKQIIVRPAAKGEVLTTLDDVKRNLHDDMIVIADASQAIGLGGVMGGLATEVTGETKTVLLEAAAFRGVNVRRTSRELGLRSEASGRFERGVDRTAILQALDRAAGLLAAMGAAEVCPGIADEYLDVSLPKQIRTSVAAINRRLGTALNGAQMAGILTPLGFHVDLANEHLVITTPSWRSDVTGTADISEEVARCYGFDNIPATMPVGPIKEGGQSEEADLIDKLRDQLTACGLDETISYSFIHASLFDKLGLAPDDARRAAIPVLNPITDEFELMRTTLAGSVLQTVAYNASRRNENIRVFEIGKTYFAEALPLKALPVETNQLCIAMTGARYDGAWNRERDEVDFYDLKGILESLLAALGMPSATFSATTSVNYLHPGKSALVQVDGRPLGVMGEIHPSVANAFDLEKKVYLAEIDLGVLLDGWVHRRQYKALPKYPGSLRDLAFLASADITAQEIEAVVRTAAGPLLRSVSLFDVYEGKQVPEGKRSMAFSLQFQADDRTLKDEEVDSSIAQIISALQASLKISLRS